MALTTVNSDGIKDDSIVNADIKSDAAIALSKLASTPAVLTGSTNNQITTVTAANAIQGEANLQFDGTGLGIGRAPTAGYLLDIAGTGAPTLKIQDTDGTNQFVDMSHNAGDSYWVSRNNTTNGSYRWYQNDGTTTSTAMFLDSSKRLHLGTTTTYDAEASNLVLAFTGHGGMTITSTEASKRTNIYFADASSGSGTYAGGFTYDHDDDKMILRTGSNGRMLWTNDGNVKIYDGDLLMGATGHGINFSDAQTNASGMTSETLNSYEEGTFTPSNSVGITLTNNNPAYYIKIGKLVHIQMDISFSGVSDSSQVGYIQSLPFTSTGTTNHYAQGSIQHISENGATTYDEDQNGLLMFIAPSESRIDIVVGSSNSVATRAHLEGRRFRISMFYKSAS